MTKAEIDAYFDAVYDYKEKFNEEFPGYFIDDRTYPEQTKIVRQCIKDNKLLTSTPPGSMLPKDVQEFNNTFYMYEKKFGEKFPTFFMGDHKQMTQTMLEYMKRNKPFHYPKGIVV